MYIVHVFLGDSPLIKKACKIHKGTLKALSDQLWIRYPFFCILKSDYISLQKLIANFLLHKH